MGANILQLHEIKKDQDFKFDKAAQLLSCLSSPVRLKILHFLAQGQFHVDEIAQKIHESLANTSMHLQKMKKTDLVTVTKLGRQRIYSLDQATLTFWLSCQHYFCEKFPDLNKSLDPLRWQLHKRKTIDLVNKKLIIILDIRPENEVNTIPECKTIKKDILYLNIAYDKLLAILQNKNEDFMKTHLRNLKISPRKQLLVFCRGRMCALSSEVAKQLCSHGYKAYWHDDSWNQFLQSS